MIRACPLAAARHSFVGTEDQLCFSRYLLREERREERREEPRGELREERREEACFSRLVTQ
jgi:hypothetical protein